MALLLVPALAGCLGTDQDAGTSGPSGTPAEDRSPFDGPVTVTSDCGSCFEPTVAADPTGRIFVTYAGGGLLVAEGPNGPYEPLDPPPLPEGTPPDAGVGDETVDVDPEGRLYWSALVSQAAGGDVGIQVARSDDGGGTWTVNTFVSMASDPTSPVVFADRQWLGFGEDGRVHLAYWQWVPRSGVWMATSEDGGQSFSRPVLVASTAERGGSAGSPGPPVVLPGGRVVLPYTAIGADATLPVDDARPSVVRVGLSDDRGQSWQAVEVHQLENGPASRPVAAVDAQGRVHLAWTDTGGGTWLSSSTDGGESWSPPLPWTATDQEKPLQPWLRSHGTEVALTWFREVGDRWELVAATGHPGEPASQEHVVLATDIPAAQQGGGTGGDHAGTTDFPHHDLLPDGRAVVTWSNGEAVFTAVEQPER